MAKDFFNFAGFSTPASRNTDPNILVRFLKNLSRNLKATGPMFLLGVALSALFQRYVPSELAARLFGENQGFGILMAAILWRYAGKPAAGTGEDFADEASIEDLRGNGFIWRRTA